MKFCQKCGKEINDDAIVCIHCGRSVTNETTAPKDYYYDKASAGLIVVSVLFPIVGLILWIVKHDSTPNAAKAYGTAALISFIISLVISIISWSYISSLIYY